MKHALQSVCWPLCLTLYRKRIQRGLWEADSWELEAVESDRQALRVALHCEAGGETEAGQRYRWSGLSLELHRDERAAYRFNLSAGRPRLFVVCNEEEGEMRPWLVTASQDEAASYMDGGEEDVFSIAMPEALQCWVEAFIAQHGEPDLGLNKGKRRRYRGARKAEVDHEQCH